ncbi:hypothetical protein WH50_07665 [Pokkaliibacter plantistimulans]|uniref:CRISPR type III-associated protein domain-containing protein n=1 Tax=Pokkaliibacter plantistimulans TaxID=1635171 RepID=A0ABX5LYU4_9GAMM|nr:type III-B CRISPR module RAMP protein Cmr6 [Pokkaliibacter plantistimulans]PXF31849.1 hypothetical protein WH50_07665 [Pokkaliibacter plantistimulans]
MTLPLYQSGSHALDDGHPPSKTAHLGLWFERFYQGFTSNWNLETDAKAKALIEKMKKDWIKAIAKQETPSKHLQRHAEQRQQLAKGIKAHYRVFETTSPFVTGVGLSHPVENGMSWHPTLGAPYMSGAAVKGLLRAWVEEWMDFDSEQAREALVIRWFGTAKNNEHNASAGELLFFDLLPTDKVTLACEVMTPHMGGWYEKGGQVTLSKDNPDKISVNDYADKVPADWHSPVPIYFLVVRSGKFATLIGARTPEAQAEVGQAMEELAKALEWLGAGAKTATGFGRMEESAADAYEREQNQAKEAKAQKMAALTPAQQCLTEVQELMSADQAKKHPSYKDSRTGNPIFEEAKKLKELATGMSEAEKAEAKACLTAVFGYLGIDRNKAKAAKELWSSLN